jgi:hypothetical protein
MPGTLIVEAIGQSASILFSKTTGTGTQPGEVLGEMPKNWISFPVTFFVVQMLLPDSSEITLSTIIMVQGGQPRPDTRDCSRY